MPVIYRLAAAAKGRRRQGPPPPREGRRHLSLCRFVLAKIRELDLQFLSAMYLQSHF
jgi:hypothetical protein